MAKSALRMQRYMYESGAPLEAIAQVAVKAHRNSVHNPYAQYKQVFTLAEVLSSRAIADPLTLYQCCPTSEGASATVLMAAEVARRVLPRPQRAVRLAAASLRTSTHQSVTARNPNETTLAAQDAYAWAGIGPEDVDVVQVHDPTTIAEIQHLEYLGFFPPGEAWRATLDGETEITGKLPVNTDGGEQAMGHPFGATSIRMLHELLVQMRGEAGDRQVPRARVGLAHSAGTGGVATVIMLGGA